MIPEITKTRQTSLYYPVDKELKISRISPVEDFYAHGFDRKRCALAVMGYGNRRSIDPEHAVPLKCPTTRLEHIIRINCRREANGPIL